MSAGPGLPCLHSHCPVGRSGIGDSRPPVLNTCPVLPYALAGAWKSSRPFEIQPFTVEPLPGGQSGVYQAAAGGDESCRCKNVSGSRNLNGGPTGNRLGAGCHRTACTCTGTLVAGRESFPPSASASANSRGSQLEKNTIQLATRPTHQQMAELCTCASFRRLTVRDGLAPDPAQSQRRCHQPSFQAPNPALCSATGTKVGR